MTPEQFIELQRTVSDQIKITVNGKIDRIDKKLDDYILRDEEHRASYKEETDVWRKQADEKLELVANIRGFGRVFMYIVGVIVAIGTIYKIFK